MGAKIRHRAKLLEFIGNIDNSFPKRKEFPEICGVTKTTLYKHFTPAEFSEIENEALTIRKNQSAPGRDRVYKQLLKEAESGNVPAIKEFLDRTEGKVLEKKEIKVEGKDLAPILNVTLSE